MTQSPKGPRPSPKKRKEILSDKAQSERFMEAARIASIDESVPFVEAELSKIIKFKRDDD